MFNVARLGNYLPTLLTWYHGLKVVPTKTQFHSYVEVQIFWEGNTDLKKNLPTCFDITKYFQKQVGYFFQILKPSHNIWALKGVKMYYRNLWNHLHCCFPCSNESLLHSPYDQNRPKIVHLYRQLDLPIFPTILL